MSADVARSAIVTSRDRLPDQDARDRIVTDLETSLLVEAGAGSGKTRALVDRMVALVGTGRADVHQIAAVTFTKKAASELRERFQTTLETSIRVVGKGEIDRHDPAQRAISLWSTGPLEVGRRLEAALRHIDRAFLGTIHSFCARLLRERPIDAGLDPDFREVVDPEAEELRIRFWHRWLEERNADGSPLLVGLREVGLDPTSLYDCFKTLDEYPDVRFAAEPVERPDTTAVRREFERLLDRAEARMPGEEPDKGWDDLQRLVRECRFLRRSGRWASDIVFFDRLAWVVGKSGTMVTQYKWGDAPARKAMAKKLGDAFLAFGAEGETAHKTLDRWFAHRYPAAIEFGRRAANAYAVERRRTGRLGFQDLLMEAARLLRESPAARRDLARRFRYLLVDEFQDTDPVQAEVVFLLTANDPETTGWREAVPRPGALFVVGDPKQSIYRFTRADIAVYGLAKRRFEASRERGVADIVELTTNFRSRPPIAAFVNDEFARRFPEEATLQQAAFAPINVHRGDGPYQGVWRYGIPGAPKGQTPDALVAEEDAERLAGWIARRVTEGERRYGEFLILTYRRSHIDRYAEALEARNIPVEVSGGELMIEEELVEFRHLLEALLDPDDPVRTVAVLVGLFFGLNYELLTRHRMAGGTFRFNRAGDRPEGPVSEALDTLGRWWRLARSAPADVIVPTILAELGLLPYAAAGDLGAPRAGAIGFFLDVVHRAGLEGDTSLRGALEAIDVALNAEEAVAPLQPGRADVVRLMNLHRAKGLEAPVVVLAHPTATYPREPRMHIDREAEGDVRGFLEISLPGKRPWQRTVIARPLDWARRRAAETEFRDAERERLLYVAATRAGEELLVSRCAKTDRKSFWEPFYGCLERKWPELELERARRPARRRLERPVAEIRAAIRAVEDRRERGKQPSYVAASVTERVKADDTSVSKGAGGRGREWGSAVHQALETAARIDDDETLEGVCRMALVANQRPVESDGAPSELTELVGLVRAVAGSDLIERARDADRVLSEVPFAWPRPDTEPREIVEGVIDLAFREEAGWTIVDYKTDVVDDEAALTERRRLYRAQVDLYAECWEALSGEPVVERTLFFTATGEIERW